VSASAVAARNPGHTLINLRQYGRGAAAGSILLALAACSSTGGLRSVLGNVAGTGEGASRVSGYVLRVDTRSQSIALDALDGQSLNLLYDNDTKVVYNNQTYPVTSLDRGDQVTASVQSTKRGYYTDLVRVEQPVRGSDASTASRNVQTIQGTVRDVDTQNGLFSLDVGAGARVTVSMPYSPSHADQHRFENLHQGDNVRMAGVYLNSSRVELRQFY
jgi:hypothetical protein